MYRKHLSQTKFRFAEENIEKKEESSKCSEKT